MIEALQMAGYGLLFALWAGTMLGYLIEWDQRVLVGMIFLFGGIVVFGTLLLGPEAVVTGQGVEGNDGLNWPFLLGTVPGYLIGFLAGKSLYRKVNGE